MSKVRQAVVMVGGKGTRLRPLTNERPKPILPVLDRPCLSYLISSLAKGGIEEVFLACGYRPEEMASVIGDGSAEGISIEYSYEDPPAGTAGAIKLLEDRLDDTFVACNG
ncbi:MAG: nucleotidyltransferase family protein, partial [Methanomassiliicoccaceae archaeon]|nr:nucleotidyltransferase family protein [Methanomassiliicoccaceae archaeon]